MLCKFYKIYLTSQISFLNPPIFQSNRSTNSLTDRDNLEIYNICLSDLADDNNEAILLFKYQYHVSFGETKKTTRVRIRNNFRLASESNC